MLNLLGPPVSLSRRAPSSFARSDRRDPDSPHLFLVAPELDNPSFGSRWLHLETVPFGHGGSHCSCGLQESDKGRPGARAGQGQARACGSTGCARAVGSKGQSLLGTAVTSLVHSFFSRQVRYHISCPRTASVFLQAPAVQMISVSRWQAGDTGCASSSWVLSQKGRV